MEGIQGLRVLVTAGCSGIGLAIADGFAVAGARVQVCDVNQETLSACREMRPDFLCSLADVAEPEDVDRLFEETVTQMGGLDVLVNNAGIAGPTAPIEEIEVEDWRRTIAVDLDSHYLCARKAAPMMKHQRGGSIVNISSTAGQVGYPLRTPYACAKWAVIGLTKSLAMELGPFNVRVNAICPGSVDGPRMDRVIEAEANTRGVTEEQVRREYERQASLRSFVKAEDIANAAVFLCSPAGAKVSGQALAVDGHIEGASKLDD